MLFSPEIFLQYLPKLTKISLHSNNFTSTSNCKKIVTIKIFIENKGVEST